MSQQRAFSEMFDVPTSVALATPTPHPTATHKSRLELVADYFRARPNEWIDGRELAGAGSAYAWRTRASECRKKLGMRIDNRQRDGGLDANGEPTTISEYRYVPEVE